MELEWSNQGDLLTSRVVCGCRWPHKCSICGRFVKHDQLRSTSDVEGVYWSTAYCEHCQKRTNVNPI